MSIFDEIMTEREKQDQKWGGKSHDLTHVSGDWCYFIKTQILKFTFGRQTFRTSMVNVAALAVAALECLDITINP